MGIFLTQRPTTPQGVIDAFLAKGNSIKQCPTNVAKGIKLRSLVSGAVYKQVTAEQRAARQHA